MAAAVGAPSAYSNIQLDARHARNFDLMLRSLRISAGSNVFSGTQSTINKVNSSPQVTFDREGLVTEAKAFQPMAYGATLGLIYYRMLGNQHRLMWDAAISRQIGQSAIMHSRLVQDRRDAGAAMKTSPALSRDPVWRKNFDNSAQTIQNYARYLDFLYVISTKKMSVFPGMSDEILNNPLVIGANPWCLGTRPEFSEAYREVFSTPAYAEPGFYRGTPEERESLLAVSAKMAEIAIEAKAVEYIALFLEKSAEAISNEALREGMSYVCKFPVVDLLVDFLKDQNTKSHLLHVRRIYEQDLERRLFLFRLGWGIWPKPELDRVTAADLQSFKMQR